MAGLSKAVRKLVLEECRGRRECCGDSLDGWYGLFRVGLEGGKVLEGEERAEAARERLTFRGDYSTEGGDLSVWDVLCCHLCCSVLSVLVHQGIRRAANWEFEALLDACHKFLAGRQRGVMKSNLI